jgi:hypothetical protein
MVMITNAEDARTKLAIARKKMLDGANVEGLLEQIEEAAQLGHSVLVVGPMTEGQALKLEALGFEVEEGGTEWGVSW